MEKLKGRYKEPLSPEEKVRNTLVEKLYRGELERFDVNRLRRSINSLRDMGMKSRFSTMEAYRLMPHRMNVRDFLKICGEIPPKLHLNNNAWGDIDDLGKNKFWRVGVEYPTGREVVGRIFSADEDSLIIEYHRNGAAGLVSLPLGQSIRWIGYDKNLKPVASDS